MRRAFLVFLLLALSGCAQLDICSDREKDGGIGGTGECRDARDARLAAGTSASRDDTT